VSVCVWEHWILVGVIDLIYNYPFSLRSLFLIPFLRSFLRRWHFVAKGMVDDEVSKGMNSNLKFLRDNHVAIY
jgi:hypothetical protein